MDDVEEFTPKDLEVLPNKIVHDILHYGITHDSSFNGSNDDSTSGVSKDSKKYNPKNRKFKKEALCSMNRVASLFVLYIATIAESIAKSNKRSTVYDRDVLEALRQCMFWEVETQIADAENQDPDGSLSKKGEGPDVENDAEMEAEDDNLDNEDAEVEEEVEMEEDVDASDADNPDESLDNNMTSEENNDLYPYKLL